MRPWSIIVGTQMRPMIVERSRINEIKMILECNPKGIGNQQIGDWSWNDHENTCQYYYNVHELIN